MMEKDYVLVALGTVDHVYLVTSVRSCCHGEES